MAIDEHDRRDARGPEVIRHDEELRVTFEAVPFERIRVVKRVVSETVQIDVVLRHEELVVERLPVEEPEGDRPVAPRATAVEDAAGTRDETPLGRFAARRRPVEVSADEVAVELLEERYEVVKRVVPHERVRLVRAVTTADAPITGTVRKEQIDVDEEELDGRVD